MGEGLRSLPQQSFNCDFLVDLGGWRFSLWEREGQFNYNSVPKKASRPIKQERKAIILYWIWPDRRIILLSFPFENATQSFVSSSKESLLYFPRGIICILCRECSSLKAIPYHNYQVWQTNHLLQAPHIVHSFFEFDPNRDSIPMFGSLRHRFTTPQRASR